MEAIIGKGYDLTEDGKHEVRIDVELSGKQYELMTHTNLSHHPKAPKFIVSYGENKNVGGGWINQGRKCKYITLSLTLDEYKYRLLMFKRDASTYNNDGDHQFVLILKKTELVKTESLL